MSGGEGWRKSSYSSFNGNCVEVWAKSSYSFREANCLEWRFHRSSHSDSGNCAEAALRHGTVQVRDSKLGGASPVLSFSPAAWQKFIVQIMEDGNV